MRFWLIVSFINISAFESFNFKSISSGIRRTNLYSTTSEDVIAQYEEELISLRGTPELVDRLENLASKFPGIEVDINLYRTIYPFPLDEFQEQGLLNLISGKNVIVSTPTGSGKTIIGELAIYFALMMGLKVAYTTPLKALSNQKFQDFSRRYGGDRVGLLTGDVAINRGAPVTVMTTEVFRNMIYDPDSQNQLSNLFMVCFDEFHYMNDPERGTVWEESVISCPPFIRILALSATMGNVDDIQGWIESIHGPTELIVSDFRPVPLRYFFALKKNLLPLFRDPNAGPGTLNGLKKVDGKYESGVSINPSILKLEEQAIQSAQMRMTKSGRPIKAQKINPASMIPKYSELVVELQTLRLLPAIVFIFSRTGCEENAKFVLQSRVKLLSDDEVNYVTQAINTFAKTHPEIPISKSSVQMLRSGVGVHHAGLIPVWKAFIEDLFNANKIKMLFATETLAAGVNMPARTTIISSVTKRISSEVIRLKTSQLLQMAGRAGRRGKDTEGTVIIMRNRFEDVKMSHKILTTPVDGIKSHFRISYGLAVKLLETKSIEDCKELIERGFGAFVLQKRVKKKETEEMLEIEKYRLILQKYTLKGARDYFKLIRRLEKEKANEKFLMDKFKESDSDLIEAIVEYMPLGVGVQLRSGEGGFFLGDVKWGPNNMNSGYGMVTRDRKILIMKKEHMKSFTDPDASIPAKKASELLDVLSMITNWNERQIPQVKVPLLEGIITEKMIIEKEGLNSILYFIDTASEFPEPQIPGSIIKQRQLIDTIQKEIEINPVVLNEDQELVINALRYASTLKDPLQFVNSFGGKNDDKDREIFAWTMFQNVLRVMQQFQALDGYAPTELGRSISSLSGDNELWVALTLQREGMKELNAAELAAVMCGLVTDGYKAKNAYFKYQPSDKVQAMYADLEQLSYDVREAQMEYGVEFPIHLCTEMGGLVESWVSGLTWRELCKDTNMDQGDLCRTFRRTVELLKQIPQVYGISESMSKAAQEAAKKMNRFPVADVDTELPDPNTIISSSGSTSTTKSAGVGFGNFEGNVVDPSDYDEKTLLLREVEEMEESNLFLDDDDEDEDDVIDKSLFLGDEDDDVDGDDDDDVDTLGLFNRNQLDRIDNNEEENLENENNQFDTIQKDTKKRKFEDINIDKLDDDDDELIRQKEYDTILKNIEAKYNVPGNTSLDSRKNYGRPIKAPTVTPKNKYRVPKTRDIRQVNKKDEFSGPPVTGGPPIDSDLSFESDLNDLLNRLKENE